MTRTKQAEPAHVTAAYQAFLLQPAPRNIKRLAAQIGKPERTVFWWQRRWSWRTRATAHDTKLIEAAQADKDEERATVAVLKGTYQAIKHTMGGYIKYVKEREAKGLPVTERELYTCMKVLDMLEKNYSELLSTPDDVPAA